MTPWRYLKDGHKIMLIITALWIFSAIYMGHFFFVQRPWMSYGEKIAAGINFSTSAIPDDWESYCSQWQKGIFTYFIYMILVILCNLYVLGWMFAFLWKKGVLQIIIVLYALYKIVMHGKNPVPRKKGLSDAEIARRKQIDFWIHHKATEKDKARLHLKENRRFFMECVRCSLNKMTAGKPWIRKTKET